MAMRENGRGHAALKKRCGFLNLPDSQHLATVSDIYS